LECGEFELPGDPLRLPWFNSKEKCTKKRNSLRSPRKLVG
jgi:hypothetical protein